MDAVRGGTGTSTGPFPEAWCGWCLLQMLRDKRTRGKVRLAVETDVAPESLGGASPVPAETLALLGALPMGYGGAMYSVSC